MLLFKNDGLIDIFGIKTFGASAKEGENPIGFFGTGLKYAIAVILRERGFISIWRGEERYVFATKQITTRGKSFDVVTMNGEELSFTTELGKTWEPWQAFRELYCNAKDENGTCERASLGIPAPGTTMITVDCHKLDVAFSQIDDIILAPSKKLLYRTEQLEIYDGVSAFLFYRGVRVGALNRPTLFTYNLVEPTTLTEDRSLREAYTFQSRIVHTLQECTDKAIAEKALTAGKQFHESECFYERYYTTSNEFWEVLRELKKDFSRPLNPNALRLRMEEDLRDLPHGIEHLDARKTAMLKRSIAFLKRMGFPVDDYPIVVADQLGDGIMGRAFQNRIYLSAIPFDKGVKQVVATLFEEWVHLAHGVMDETRAMQDVLMEKMIEQAEYRFNDFL